LAGGAKRPGVIAPLTALSRERHRLGADGTRRFHLPASQIRFREKDREQRVKPGKSAPLVSALEQSQAISGAAAQHIGETEGRRQPGSTRGDVALLRNRDSALTHLRCLAHVALDKERVGEGPGGHVDAVSVVERLAQAHTLGGQAERFPEDSAFGEYLG